VEARQGRKRAGNLSEAKAALLARISQAKADKSASRSAHQKKSQVGSGMRADKTVTIRMQDNTVTHHGTGKTMRADRYMKGQMDKLW